MYNQYVSLFGNYFNILIYVFYVIFYTLVEMGLLQKTGHCAARKIMHYLTNQRNCLILDALPAVPKAS